jgi:hypothetical protein
MAFKMKGYSYPGSSPITKKAGPETGKFDVDNIPKITSEDEETAYENAQNDYDTDNPTKEQLAIALAKVQSQNRSRKSIKAYEERKAKREGDAR